MTLNQKLQAKHRALFFKALGIEDDGRRNSQMTEEEFKAFDKPCKELKYNELEGKTTVVIYFKFRAFYDTNFIYSFDDDTVYEDNFYIGD